MGLGSQSCEIFTLSSKDHCVKVTTVPEEVGVTVCDQALLLPFELDHLVLIVGQPK